MSTSFLFFMFLVLSLLPECEYVRFRSLLSNIRLSSVCNVRSPYLGGWTVPFGNISSPFCTLAILWPPCKILRRSSQGNPSIWDVKHKRDSKKERRHDRVSQLLGFMLWRPAGLFYAVMPSWPVLCCDAQLACFMLWCPAGLFYAVMPSWPVLCCRLDTKLSTLQFPISKQV